MASEAECLASDEWRRKLCNGRKWWSGAESGSWVRLVCGGWYSEVVRSWR